MFETRHACIFVAMKVDYLPFIFIAIFCGKLFDYQRVHPNLPSIFHQYSINIRLVFHYIPSIFHQYPISIPLYCTIISSLSHHFSLLNPHHSLPLSLPPSLRHPVFTKDMRRGVLGQMTVAFFATWTGNSG